MTCRGGEEVTDHYHIKSSAGRITIDDERFFASLDELINVGAVNGLDGAPSL